MNGAPILAQDLNRRQTVANELVVRGIAPKIAQIIAAGAPSPTGGVPQTPLATLKLGGGTPVSIFSTISKIANVARIAAPFLPGPVGTAINVAASLGSLSAAPSRRAAVPRLPPPAGSRPPPGGGFPFPLPDIGDIFGFGEGFFGNGNGKPNGPVVSSTGRLTGVRVGGRYFSNRRIVGLAKQLGLQQAANCLGVDAGIVCQAIINVPRRRSRGISSRDLRTTKRVARRLHGMSKDLKKAVGGR